MARKKVDVPAAKEKKKRAPWSEERKKGLADKMAVIHQPKPKDLHHLAFDWTSEIENEICQHVANHAMSLKESCRKHPHWPKQNLIYEHVNKADEPGGFGDKYLAAKLKQVQAYVDESFDILDEVRDTPELIPWAKESISLRKWYSAKLAPRLYGDKVEQIIITNTSELSEENAALKEKIALLQADRERDY